MASINTYRLVDVATDSSTGVALTFRSGVVIVDETLATESVEPSDGHIRTDHSCTPRISTRSESHVLPVV